MRAGGDNDAVSRPDEAPARRRLRNGLVLLGSASVVAGVAALVLIATGDHLDDTADLFQPVIGWAFIGTGLFAWWQRPANTFGALMTAVGFACLAASLTAVDAFALFTVGALASALPYVLLVHVLLAFPSGRLERGLPRGVAALSYGSLALQWLPLLAFNSTRTDCDCPRNELLAIDDERAADALAAGQAVVAMLVVAGLIAVIVGRRRRASPALRRALAPVLGAGAAVALVLGLGVLGRAADAPSGLQEPLDVAALSAVLLVPFAFVTGLLRTRVSHASAVTTLVARLSQPSAHRRRLREELATALGDPSLELAYWLPERGRYVDASGAPVEIPPRGPHRVATTVEHDGILLAAIIHDAALTEERELVRTVGAAASMALENERLEAELRARVEELRSSRARVVEAGLAERRRLERDLHDGAQQRLVALALALRMARSRLGKQAPAVGEMLDAASRDLKAAHEELRELARGIHPAVLSDRGLGPAIEALAARAPVPVEIASAPAKRLPQPVEAAAYFVVAEALTNVAKYAHASQARVRVDLLEDRVVVEVTDDGTGGAYPEGGSGLRGLTDRLGALDGSLEVESPPGVGTTLRATIPLSS